MPRRSRKQGRVPPVTLSKPAGGRRASIWLLEGGIIVLVGLNGYFLYSALAPAAPSPRLTPPRTSAVRPAHEKVQVEVLNGCGKVGIGQRVRDYLRTQGFDVVNIENAEDFQFPETIVLDRRGQTAVSDAALAVAQALGTTHVILQRNDDRMVDVTAIIGQDYDQLRLSQE